MAKKKITSKKTPVRKIAKKPNVGDTVYVKGESEYRQWYFAEKIVNDGREQARCTTSIYNIKDDSTEFVEQIFPVDKLTLEPPLIPPSFIAVD